MALNIAELSAKHLLVVPRQNGCWVSVARGVAVPVLLEGQVVDNQEIPWGSELDIGTITLRFKEPAAVVQARAESQRSLLRLAGLAALALAVFYFLQDRRPVAPRAPATAPELFTERKIKCDDRASTMTQRGREVSTAGTAYWQRYPFDPQEGVRAYRLFLEAEDCFSGAGLPTLSDKAAQDRREVEDHMQRDYQTMRLQLMRALKNREHKVASGLVYELSRFIKHVPGEYFDWLVRVDRYLRQQEKQ